MPILKIQPDAISNTESFVFGNVTATSITANGVNLGTAVAEAFVLANNASKTTTSDTAPADPKVGDTWFDTVTNVLLRYTNDGVSNNWIDITGPTNSGYIYQTYAITPNTSTINETTGNTVSYTVTTTNTADNTVLYWTNSGTTAAADFSDSVSNGTVTITNNSGTFTRSIIAESVTEGSETIILSLRTGSNTGPIVAVATTVTVNDTSLDPYYAIFSTGYNQNGELGLNDRNVYRSSPTQIGSQTNWSKIAVGGGSQQYGVVASIKTDGTLWLWGQGNYGKMGQGDNISRSSPTQVGTLTSWSDVVIDRNAAAVMAIRTDGTIWTWGLNNYSGVLGHNQSGSGSNKNSPTQVGTETNWSKIGASSSVFASIKTDGTLWLWGSNSYGKLGLGDTNHRSSPTQLGSSTDWASLPRGGGNWMGAIKTNGTLWTWGGNWQTQTGSNRSGNFNPVLPTQQTGSNWSKLAIGTDHGLAIKTDGTLWGWGNNSRTQLTNSVGSYANITQIGNSTTWAEVSTGQYETVALKTDGTIWAWGKNTVGALGLNGSNNSYINSPTQIGTGTNWGAVAVGSMTVLRTNSQ
jgi:alpha-tubulin suppressor-like RCC1 family protein